MKRKSMKVVAIVLAMSLLLLSVAACGEKSTNTNENTLTLSLRMDIASLNPLNIQLESENMVAISMFMPLFYYAVNVDEARSDACEEMTISDDAKTYTFKIKEGITFHNGEELSLEDVVYSIKSASESPAQYAWAGNFVNAEVTGDREVTVTLAEADANFFKTANIYLLNEKTVQEAGEDFDLNPIGCGPYKFVSFEPGYKLTLEAFEDYIDGKPAFTNLVYSIMVDDSAAVIALENGETDAIATTSYVEYESLKANDKIGVTLIQSAVDMFILNENIAPYDNVKVRQAINYAIDKERASEAYSEGVAPVSTSLIPWIQDDSLKGYPYDPEKAKALLAEAGYPEGNGFPEVKIVTLDTYKTYAQIIQEDLSAIGIKAEVELGEATAMTEQLLAGNVPFSVFGISLGFDSSQYNMVLCTDQPYNLAFYSNPEMDELFTEVRKEIDTEKSKETYLEILKLQEEDAVYGLLCDTLIMYAYNDSYDFEKAFENFSSSGVRPQDITPKE